MKRARSRLQQVVGYLLAAWGAWCWLGGEVDAIRSQLTYGFAIDRSGRPYNVWTFPAVLVGGLMLFLGYLIVQELRLVWRAGRSGDSGITYSEPSPRLRRRRKHRR